MAPWDVKNIVEKVDKENGDKLLLTERDLHLVIII